MASKVDEKVLKRILQLKYEQGLTDRVISIRMGISERTIRVYTRANREGTVPYRPDEKLNVSPETSPEKTN